MTEIAQVPTQPQAPQPSVTPGADDQNNTNKTPSANNNNDINAAAARIRDEKLGQIDSAIQKYLPQSKKAAELYAQFTQAGGHSPGKLDHAERSAVFRALASHLQSTNKGLYDKLMADVKEPCEYLDINLSWKPLDTSPKAFVSSAPNDQQHVAQLAQRLILKDYNDGMATRSNNPSQNPGVTAPQPNQPVRPGQQTNTQDDPTVALQDLDSKSGKEVERITEYGAKNPEVLKQIVNTAAQQSKADGQTAEKVIAAISQGKGLTPAILEMAKDKTLATVLLNSLFLLARHEEANRTPAQTLELVAKQSNDQVQTIFAAAAKDPEALKATVSKLTQGVTGADDKTAQRVVEIVMQGKGLSQDVLAEIQGQDKQPLAQLLLNTLIELQKEKPAVTLQKAATGQQPWVQSIFAAAKNPEVLTKALNAARAQVPGVDQATVQQVKEVLTKDSALTESTLQNATKNGQFAELLLATMNEISKTLQPSAQNEPVQPQQPTANASQQTQDRDLMLARTRASLPA